MLRVITVVTGILIAVNWWGPLAKARFPAQSIQETLPNDRAVKSSKNLNAFARELQACMKPGPLTKAWACRWKEKAPLEKLLLAYQELRENWIYVYDDFQEHQSAEASLNPHSARFLQGDCEDYAGTIASILIANDLSVRLLLCSAEPENPSHHHHCFCEVLIASDLPSARPLLAKLGQAWKISELMYRQDKDGVWIALDFHPPKKLHLGEPYLLIFPDKFLHLKNP